MKVRKLKRARARVTLSHACLPSDEAARVLHMSRDYFDGLVRTGELVPTRRTRAVHQWFSMANLLAYVPATTGRMMTSDLRKIG